MTTTKAQRRGWLALALPILVSACRPEPEALTTPSADRVATAAPTQTAGAAPLPPSPSAASASPSTAAPSSAASSSAGASSAASPSGAAAACASAAVAALDGKDMRRLSELSHPVAGVRFTPFGFVRPADDVVLRASELASAMTDPKVRNWGILGESDDPIRLTFAKFFARFVYDAPFARLGVAPGAAAANFESASHNVGELQKTLAAAYPRAAVFEYRKPPSGASLPDWRVLRLVCQEHEGKHWLVGIVHSEWTP